MAINTARKEEAGIAFMAATSYNANNPVFL
jgi:hypothetical protein